MNDQDRDRITQNLTALMSKIHDVNRLISFIEEAGLFTDSMVQDIKAERTPDQQKVRLLHRIQTRGPTAFDKFIKCLVDCQYTEAARILRPDLVDGGEQQVDFERYEERYPDGPIEEVRVRNANQFNNGESENEVYRMRSNPRGFALIFANSKFTNSTEYEDRPHCEKDIQLLSDLFRELNYTVEIHPEKTKAEVDDIISEFTTRPTLKDVDSLLVAVSSHGVRRGFVCTDDIVYDADEFYSRFNNVNCPGLKTKPKVFFMQACRGIAYDHGVAATVSDSLSYGIAVKDPPHISTETDMLIVYSTRLGLRAFGNIYHGSWMFVSLVRIFMEYAWKEDVKKLLQRVSRDVARFRHSNQGEKQPMEIVVRNFDYDMYFNPGL